MGKVLQSKKRKSNRPKVVRKPKSKKQLIKNPIIAAHWDSKKTLSQNYKALGLSTRLNRQTGGLEKKTLGAGNPDALSLSARPETRPEAAEEATIVRDPATGETKIVGAAKKPRANPLNDPLNDLESSSDDDGGGRPQTAFTPHHFAHVPSSIPDGAESLAVRQLEARAANGGRKAPRMQSERERDWCRRLVETHGDDYTAMFWDRELNVMQQSVGDIRRRVRRWRESQEGRGEGRAG